jgi:hypothetical protein
MAEDVRSSSQTTGDFLATRGEIMGISPLSISSFMAPHQEQSTQNTLENQP